MPIYAYKCSSCGHAQDILQKISDAPLTECPACAAPSFAKQVTAAGFQLKGSGWYVTDFRDGGKKAGKETDAKPEAGAPGAAQPGEAKPAESKPQTGEAARSEARTETKSEATPAAPSPAA